jgi:hypothetical protein
MAEGDKAPESKDSGGKTTTAVSLEILFGSALAGAASLLKDPSQRTLATSMAPAIGYIIVKLGRRLVDDWIPKWITPKPLPPETPVSRIKVFIEDAKKELHSGTLTPEEVKRKELHISGLEDALQKKLLDDLLAMPTSKSLDTTESSKEGAQKLLDK